MQAISVAALSSYLTEFSRPVLIDVRRQGARKAAGVTVENAVWRDPALWLDWKDEVATMSGQVVFFCVHGHEVSQGITAALCAMGKDAKYLEGGFAEWQQAGLLVVPIANSSSTACQSETHNGLPKMIAV
jgi:thiosulfate sulfurtransferase